MNYHLYCIRKNIANEMHELNRFTLQKLTKNKREKERGTMTKDKRKWLSVNLFIFNMVTLVKSNLIITAIRMILQRKKLQHKKYP